MQLRLVLGMAGGAAVAFAATVALGEYGFSGLAVVGSGLVVGLFVSEVTVSVSRQRSWLLAAAGAVMAVGGLLGAAWTSTGHRLSEIPAEGWLALGVAAASAAFRARPLRAGPDSPPPPSPPPPT